MVPRLPPNDVVFGHFLYRGFFGPDELAEFSCIASIIAWLQTNLNVLPFLKKWRPGTKFPFLFNSNSFVRLILKRSKTSLVVMTSKALDD
jgi:hypothetical protein